MIQKLFLFIVFLISSITMQAQQKQTKPPRIIYRGQVFDENKQPLPFVNVYMAKGKYGTTTDFEGKFVLKTRRKRGKITFSMQGYQTKVIKIKPKMNFIKVYLKPEKNVLEEIVIVKRPKKHLGKKENPAYKILKQIWAHRRKNGLKKVSQYSYTKHELTEIGLNHLDSLFLQKLFKKDYAAILKKLPPDESGTQFKLPIYVKEKVTRIYGDNRLGKKRVDIVAEKTKGFNTQGFIFDRLSQKFESVDVYNNTFNLFNKAFVSPVSSTGFDTYDYVLYDSIQKNNQKYYNIYFFPRREGDLAFEGNFLVSDKNFAITKIQMRLKADANLNFVRGVQIEKSYKTVNDSIYLPEKDSFEGDFSLLNKNELHKGLNVKTVYTYTDYQLNPNLPPSFFAEENLQYKPNQYQKPEAYWQKWERNGQAKQTYALIEAVKNKKQIGRINKWLNILTTGFFKVSSGLQFGPLFQAIGQNGVEGLRLMAGLRTFKTPNDRFRAYAHLAYGTKDHRFKWALSGKYLLSFKPRILLEAGVSDDYVQQSRSLMDVSELMFTENFGANFLLSRDQNIFLSRIKQGYIKFDFRMAKNFHVGLRPAYRYITSANPAGFKLDYIDEEGRLHHSLTDIGSAFYLAYTPGRKVYGFGVEQRYGKNPYPSIILKYYKGTSWLGGDFNYDKLQLRYNQRILWGKVGRTDFSLETGKTFGKVPLALLNPIPANQILILKPYTFSLINYYDYVTDTYAATFITHHFDGFILNRLPLLKHLKLRSLFSFRAAYGTISPENIAINRSNIRYAAPTGWYYEYSVGLENIGFGNLRFIRVDAVWRSDYHSVNGLTSPKFAFRIAFKPDF